MGWAYMTVLVTSQAITGLILVPRNPELVEDRTQVERESTRKWDRPLTGIVSLFGPIATLIVAGLNVRYTWSQPPLPGIQGAALLVGVIGSTITVWAMASNKFFYGFVRIKKDRGHTTITTGPYRFVRHPGYAGAIIFALATPAFLGTLWALIPAGLTVCALVIRTALEDRTLANELDGYRAYSQDVRYRLLPGVW
jgi:protein-S-isoprenylcysteine O-methyltransferase Ste14